MNIIECTIKMRKAAQENLQNLSAKVTDSEMKRLFALLAAVEDEHIASLMKINEELKVSADTDSSLSAQVCVYNPEVSSSNFGKVLRNDPDAYIHLLHEEEEVIDFFDRLAEKTDLEIMKNVCLAAAENEREHLLRIENIYAFVEAPRTYLEWGEFSNLKTL